MGLMYVFPVGEDETDFIDKKDGSLTLKTYGLPYIFWIYAICVVAVIFFMFLAIKAPVLKLIELGDETDATLGYTLLSFIGLLPVFIFGFFFYEKRIIRKGKNLTLQHRVFAVPVFTETFEVESSDELKIEAFMDSPNVAKINATEANVGFQNKGYFVLYLMSKSGQKILVDRHSRKADLEKLKKLISIA
ncbi:hypothetical protein ACJVC5_14400 [Peredibacter sp. HCB2-198]|uniref:hypothetical protein n=1 Tax=Peredibacter sp. HCB2-198 TaxID=3383025 RepID=UPI0038B51FC1